MSFFGNLFKDPLKTAALGAGLYFTGGAIAPYLAGGGAAATGAASTVPIAEGVFAGATPAELLAANGGGASGGLLGSIGGMKNYAEPAMQALSAANSAQGLLSDGQIPAPQVPQGGGEGSQTLASLYQQGMQMSPEDQARMQRKTQWG
jgi:hypothetical protein